MLILNNNEVIQIVKEELASLIGLVPEEIELENSLDDYDLDSINRVRLASYLSDRLNIEIDPIVFLEVETIQGFIDVIGKLATGDEPDNNHSLNTDCVLPEAFVDVMSKNVESTKTMNRPLLTGGTGFIGAYLISEILQMTEADIVCLVRADNEFEGLERIKSNLQHYNLWDEKYNERLSIVCGCLEKPQFGLDSKTFLALAQTIDSIVHSGANVNFIYSYKQLKAANVDSVKTILELAVADKTKISQIHFISTLGVVMSGGYAGQLINEEEELVYDHDLPNGYEQSKYVADKIIQKAINEYNAPASIYRLGLISGDSRTGIYSKLNEFLPSFLKGCVQLKAWPYVDASLEMVPVDFIAKSIVHIMSNSKNLGKAYFALHTNPSQIEDIINFYRKEGYAIDILSWEEWKERLLNLELSELNNNALLPFLSFIKALPNIETFFPKANKTNFLSSIRTLGYECAAQITLLKKYNQHFIDVGYYEAPSR